MVGKAWGIMQVRHFPDKRGLRVPWGMTQGGNLPKNGWECLGVGSGMETFLNNKSC